MNLELTPEQRADRCEFRAFVAAEIAPHAGRWDRGGGPPSSLLDRLREKGFLGYNVNREWGGLGAKYYSSTMATRAALDAVQIHGVAFTHEKVLCVDSALLEHFLDRPAAGSNSAFEG